MFTVKKGCGSDRRSPSSITFPGSRNGCGPSIAALLCDFGFSLLLSSRIWPAVPMAADSLGGRLRSGVFSEDIPSGSAVLAVLRPAGAGGNQPSIGDCRDFG